MDDKFEFLGTLLCAIKVMRKCVIKTLSWKHIRRNAVEGPLSKESLQQASLLVMYNCIYYEINCAWCIS